ncbi:MAG: HU family DNA-binding protein [Lachnospiraceae bacterium]|nr:HU family DNA-binding protein [Lachnospiraceae bacterium]
MNRQELIDAMAKETGLSKKETEACLKAFIDVTGKTLKKGGEVSLVGFGTFKVGKRAARNGQNPQTGAKIKIPAAKVPKFKAGKGLKDLVNGAKKK